VHILSVNKYIIFLEFKVIWFSLIQHRDFFI